MRIKVTKGKRDDRFFAAHKKTLRKLEVEFYRVVREAFKELAVLLMKNTRSAKGKTPTAKVNNWIDWDAWMEHEELRYKPELLKMFAAGGAFAFRIKKAAFSTSADSRSNFTSFNAAATSVEKQEAFDPITTEAVKWAELHAAAMVVEITKATREGLKQIIVDFIPEGKNLWNYQKAIRPLVGLIEKHVMAVANFEARLLEEGIPADKVARLVERKAAKLQRWREQTIARTETANAQLRGQVEGYRQLGFTKLKRIEDPDCCDECNEIQGEIYDIDDAEAIGTIHPNCEGTWVPHSGG